MNRRTQAIIGLTVVLLGVGVVALGFLDDEATVRYVEDLLRDPAAHAAGSYTVLGVPQPQQLTVTASDGASVVEVNPSFTNTTVNAVGWQLDGKLMVSTHTLSVLGPDPVTGVSQWSFRNETREAGRAAIIGEPREATWTMTGPHMVFLIEGFVNDNGEIPAVFGVYHGSLREPMQPKPSQFQGHLLTELADGTPLPDGTLLFGVQEYTAGCSSKFLPPEAREEYEEKHDDTVAKS